MSQIVFLWERQFNQSQIIARMLHVGADTVVYHIWKGICIDNVNGLSLKADDPNSYIYKLRLNLLSRQSHLTLSEDTMDTIKALNLIIKSINIM